MFLKHRYSLTRDHAWISKTLQAQIKSKPQRRQKCMSAPTWNIQKGRWGLTEAKLQIKQKQTNKIEQTEKCWALLEAAHYSQSCSSWLQWTMQTKYEKHSNFLSHQTGMFASFSLTWGRPHSVVGGHWEAQRLWAGDSFSPQPPFPLSGNWWAQRSWWGVLGRGCGSVCWPGRPEQDQGPVGPHQSRCRFHTRTPTVDEARARHSGILDRYRRSRGNALFHWGCRSTQVTMTNDHRSQHHGSFADNTTTPTVMRWRWITATK